MSGVGGLDKQREGVLVDIDGPQHEERDEPEDAEKERQRVVQIHGSAIVQVDKKISNRLACDVR